MECTDGESGDNNKENGSKECSYVINAGSQGGENTTTLKDELSLPKGDVVDFTVIYNKNKFDVKYPLDDTVGQLKKHLQDIIGVPESLQKIMIKGLAKDDRTLRDLGVTKGARVMVVGSKLNDVLAVSTPSAQEVAEEKSSATASKEPFCRQKMHRKVLDKGVPDDVMPGIKNAKEALPPFPLSGMLNKAGGKVRLTFKLELDQVWIGTKERTDKIPMNSIKNIVSEPIEGFEQYHVMSKALRIRGHSLCVHLRGTSSIKVVLREGLQLGTTEASRYWVYWVPAQYVDSIKEAILGTWLL